MLISIKNFYLYKNALVLNVADAIMPHTSSYSPLQSMLPQLPTASIFIYFPEDC